MQIHSACQHIDPFNWQACYCSLYKKVRQLNILNILNDTQDVNTVGVPSSLDALSNTSGLMIATMAQQAKLTTFLLYNVPMNSMHIFPKTKIWNTNHDKVCVGWGCRTTVGGGEC